MYVYISTYVALYVCVSQVHQKRQCMPTVRGVLALVFSSRRTDSVKHQRRPSNASKGKREEREEEEEEEEDNANANAIYYRLSSIH